MRLCKDKNPCLKGAGHTGDCDWVGKRGTNKAPPPKKGTNTSKPVAKSGTNRSKEAERKARWREQNRDRYNEYQRAYMRQRRAGA